MQCYTNQNDKEMSMSKIGMLHPGEMGVSIAASAINSGHDVFWASNHRSEKTRTRSEKHGLRDLKSLAELCKTCEIIICICPPHAAEDVAKQVVEHGFKGIYLEANAISPKRAIQIGQMLSTKNIHFIDGGIIGGPAWESKSTWLYLSGEYANQIADCFSNGPLETKIIGDEIGKASALKMCYAAYSKGTTALLCAVLGTAESLGVREELYQQWDRDEAGFSEQIIRRATRVTAKAWRFEGEMREIAGTFHEAGLPQEFHEAAAEIYRRISGFKDAKQVPELKDVLHVLLTE
jgi:3-hydroxyisobutyrate dehydrogenase-like beta-hydroxyacid dehydrogenase